MWDRKLLKQNGKAAFKRNYWWAVLWAIVFTVLVATGTGSSSDSSYDTGIWQLGLASSTIIWLSALAGSLSLLMFVAKIVVGGPFRVGYSRWLLQSAEGDPTPSDVGYYFRGGQLGRTIAGIFCTDLVTMLWTLLFIVPGIVASYKFRLVPYLMAENEGMSGKEARRISTQLMNGYKMDAFLLDLSFIGWFLLDILTLGILGIFYLNPYVYATHCEFYRAIRDCSSQNPDGWQNQNGWQAPGADQYGQNNGNWQAADPYQQPQGGWQNSDVNQNAQNAGWQSYSADENAQNAPQQPQNPGFGGFIPVAPGAPVTPADAESPAADAAENADSSDAVPASEAPAEAEAAAESAAAPGVSDDETAGAETTQPQEPDVQICPHCGHRVTGPAHFCNMCGGKL